MQEYMDRLIGCGFPPHEAYTVCNTFMKEYGEAELEVFVKSIEASAYGVPYVD